MTSFNTLKLGLTIADQIYYHNSYR